jgi:hypothetical protein
MIIDFNVNYNKYDDKILNNYSLFNYKCPKCGAEHAFIRHGSYERNICFVEKKCNIISKRMNILRLKCNSCKSTHAILPKDVVPYCIYSLSFILNVLTDYYCVNEKISNICTNYSISFQLIYTFISRFTEFLNSCIYVLRSLGFALSSIESSIIDGINKYEIKDNFSYQYFFNCQWIFLMTKFHNNIPRLVYIGGFY